MARSTRVVNLIKNIYTLWGRKRFLLPVTYFSTKLPSACYILSDEPFYPTSNGYKNHIFCCGAKYNKFFVFIFKKLKYWCLWWFFYNKNIENLSKHIITENTRRMTPYLLKSYVPFKSNSQGRTLQSSTSTIRYPLLR